MTVDEVALALALASLLALPACGDEGGGGQGLTSTAAAGTGGEGATAGTGGTGGTGLVGGGGGAPPGCGDGEPSTDEECDDGNRQSHDGCSSGCTVESLAWTELDAAAPPLLRVDHAVAYDADRDRLVLFGGYRGGALFDTWELEGRTWRQPIPAADPPARYDHAMVFHEANHHVMIYGGNPGGGLTGLDDTWSYDGASWTLLGSGSPPGPRYQHAMAFDPVRACAVVFGGTHAGATLADTVEYCSGAWATASPTAAPPGRFGHAMAYHAGRARIVLFGGYDDTGNVAYDDTWEYDGGTWTEVTPATSPPHRRFHHLAYDAERQVVVLFGGWDGAEELYDTWEYGAGTWEETSPSPAPRGGPLAYDSLRRRVVASDVPAGGPGNGTWEYRLSSDWPGEICDSAGDEDGDGLADCADPDCEGLPCDGGVCAGGSCG